MARSRGILIGIDLGTTILKAAAFDAAAGRMLAHAARRLAVTAAPDGTREQAPSHVESALRAVFARLRSDLGGRWRRVAGIGLAAQGGSAIIADRRTGRALTPMMLWNDSRPLKYRAAIAAKKPLSFWRRLSMRDVPGAGLARLVWLRKRHGGLFNEKNMYVGAGEYLYFQLTGLWRQDPGNALQIGCYNAPRERLDERPLALVGVPLSFVAPMREGHTTNPLSARAAAAFGLPEGLPVAGPYMDHEAGFLSAAGVSESPLQCSLGTAWVGNFVLPEDVRGRSPFQLVVPSPLGGGRLVIQPLLTGNVTWDWGLGTFVAKDHRKAVAQLEEIFAEDLLPPEGLTAVPWNTQSNPFEPTAPGGGTFFGMSAHTTRHDLLRALAAGMAYELLRVLESVKNARLADSVVLGGGASRGRFFQALIASLFDPLSVFTLAEEDIAATRGVLFPFSRKVSYAVAVRVRPPGRAVRKRVLAGYERYLEVFDSLYCGAPTGGAFRFAAKREKRS